jgi:hypothetical protein
VPTLVRADPVVLQERADVCERRGRVGKPVAYFRRQLDWSLFAGQQFLQEAHVPSHVVQGDHRDAMTDQGVVGVVPFRSLRAEPDPAIDDEVAELGQQGDEQLLQQVDPVDVSAAF